MKVEADDVLDLVAHEGLVDRASLNAETRLDQLAVSSLELINILFAIEDRYKVSIDADELQGAETLGALIALVQTRSQQAGQPA